MYDLSIIVNIVSLISWLILHIVLPILKNVFIDIDAFIYEPVDKNKS